jgi:hypothetical protein
LRDKVNLRSTLVYGITGKKIELGNVLGTLHAKDGERDCVKGIMKLQEREPRNFTHQGHQERIRKK